jgi:hypothetical protein
LVTKEAEGSDFKTTKEKEQGEGGGRGERVMTQHSLNSRFSDSKGGDNRHHVDAIEERFAI